jgi:hypothetical protein
MVEFDGWRRFLRLRLRTYAMAAPANVSAKIAFFMLSAFR